MENKKIHTTFGEHLKELRETASLTLRDVSTNIGVDYSHLAKVEKNQRTPTRQLIKSLAIFFETSEQELLNDWLSDQIAYKILDENVDIKILKVAEEKVSYLKKLHNENDND